jgi:uncharacterized protein (DUF1697 family)
VTGTYVALLRGINVGGHSRIAMADLRALLAGLGYRDVRTHLQSGNVVFRAPMAGTEELQEAIEARLAAELDLSVPVLVRTGEEFLDVVAGNPLATDDPRRLLVLFLSAPIDPARLTGIDPARYAPERFVVGRSEIYVYCADGIIESQLLKVFTDARLGAAVTARNWNTVVRLAALIDA